jgi:hypothetical protein
MLRVLEIDLRSCSDGDLVLFIKRHRASLRTIVLENYLMPFRIIDAMRNMTDPQGRISYDVEFTRLFIAPHILRNYIINKMQFYLASLI